jgi:magnesium-transporting ATPase (P-type)
MNDQVPKKKQRLGILLPILVSAIAGIALLILGLWRRQRSAPAPREAPPAAPAIPPGLQGLTEAEARARQLEGQDNAVPFRPQRTRQQTIKENVLTVFNLNLVGLAFSQFLLGLPLDALISMGTIALNAVLNIIQETLARRRMKEVEVATRLQATVIREGRVRSIDPNEVVQGDILVVGPGDDFIVDGELVGEGQITVDESTLTGERTRRARQNGDKVYASSFCVSGRAAYEAQQVGTERLIISRGTSAHAPKEELTSLEKLIERVLRILLGVVVILATVLLLRFFRLEPRVPVETVASAASVIFSIAPASLFFMIFLTYAAGSADLVRLGALVNRTRAVESLAEATTLCLSKAGILTGTHIEVESIEPPGGQERFAESRIRQILGDFAHSMPADNPTMRAMVTSFEGSPRQVQETAPFLSAYGWSAIAFDDDDLRGVFVLGDPQILERHLLPGDQEAKEAPEEQEPSRMGGLRKRLSPLGRLFRRDEASLPEEAASPEEDGSTTDSAAPKSSEPATETESQPAKDSGSQEASEQSKAGFFGRFTARVRSVLPRRQSEPEEIEVAEEEPDVPDTVLLFSYCPQLESLHAVDGSPQVPKGLIPLCHLRYTERIRAETIRTIQRFSEAGVGIKILASGSADRTMALLKQAGFGSESDIPTASISGEELAEMDEAQMAEAVIEHTVFGHIVPEQAGLLVSVLREQGETVAYIGEGVGDVPAMRQANLSITGQGSSQAALSVADIVLLKDSAEVLLDILEKGQRIVNGLLDVLKLYLTQMIYLTIMIVAIRVLAGGFPYISKQGTVIAVLTLSLPAIGLSLWAAPGILPSRNLRGLMLWFVLPAAITISAAGSAIYTIFLQRSGTVEYAQLGVIYALVGMGLTLVLFLKPPGRLFGGGAPVSGDWRFVPVVLILLALFLLLAPLPITEEFLGIDRLQQSTDYATVGAVVLAWAVVLRGTWWIMSLVDRFQQSQGPPESAP